MTSPQSRSTQPFQQFVADMILWLALLLLFLTFRITLFAVFRGELSELPSLHAFVRCLNTGLRSDATAATWAILPSLAPDDCRIICPLGSGTGVSANSPPRSRCCCAESFSSRMSDISPSTTTSSIIGSLALFTTIGRRFGRRFGKAITSSCSSALMLAGVTIGSWLLNKLCGKAETGHSPGFLGTKTARVITVVVIVDLGVRRDASLAWQKFGRPKKCRINRRRFPQQDRAQSIFRVAICDVAGAHDAKIRRSADDFARRQHSRRSGRDLSRLQQNSANLDDCLKRSAPGISGAKPDHIFIVVMESYDAWAMQPEYAGLHLTDRLKQLGDSGIRAQGFVSSGISTIESLGVIITGLPFARAFVNFQPIVRRGLPTAAAPIFKQLGYKPRFFYGGYLSWQRIGEFCREQGFEEVYGGDQMVPHSRQKEWGVDDESLFRYVVEHTGAEPTFNLIMTTSYHPPYSVNLETKGFDPNVMKSDSLGKKLSDEQIRVLGHLWYSDKCVGDFVSQVESKLQRPIFAITGDHYSRKQYVSARPTHTLYESLAVPLVIHGPKALEHSFERPAAIAGSHLDIVPTFINLVAPRGF